MLALTSHFCSHFLGELKVFKANHFGVTWFDFLVLIAPVFSLYFSKFFVSMQIFYDLKELLSLLLVNTRQISLFDSLFDEFLYFFSLLLGYASFLNSFVDIGGFELETALIFALYLLLLHF